MLGKEKRNQIFKKESIFHLFLITGAIFGVGYSIWQLQQRKEKAKEELVVQFSSGFSKAIQQELLLDRDFGKKNSFVSINADMIENVFQKGSAISIPLVTEEEPSEELRRKDFDEILFSLHTGKIDNPFLFSFRDIGENIMNLISLVMYNNVNMIAYNGQRYIPKEIGKYFTGELVSEDYKIVCDVAVYLVYRLASEKDKKRIAPLGRVKGMINVGLYEYLIGASMVGDLSTCILGKQVNFSEILKEFGVPAGYLKDSTVLRVVNEKKVHFSV